MYNNNEALTNKLYYNTATTEYATTTTISDYIRSTVALSPDNLCVGKVVEKKPEVSPETRTKLDVKNGKIYVKYFEDGFFSHEKQVVEDIKDVKEYGDAIIVTFADGTKTKAVLDYEDCYSLEQGISICITKKLLGKEGSAIYNKLIDRALKIKKKNEDAVKKTEEKKLEQKKRKEAAAARKAQKKLKKREEQIEIQKEAYIRAMNTLNESEKNKKKKFSKNS